MENEKVALIAATSETIEGAGAADGSYLSQFELVENENGAYVYETLENDGDVVFFKKYELRRMRLADNLEHMRSSYALVAFNYNLAYEVTGRRYDQ